MSQAVNVIALQTQRGGLPTRALLQTGDPCALHNNDGTCHCWFILPLNLVTVGPLWTAFKRKSPEMRWMLFAQTLERRPTTAEGFQRERCILKCAIPHTPHTFSHSSGMGWSDSPEMNLTWPVSSSHRLLHRRPWGEFAMDSRQIGINLNSAEALYTWIRRCYTYTGKFHNEQIRINVISSCQRLPDGLSWMSLSLCHDFIYIPEHKQPCSFVPYQ